MSHGMEVNKKALVGSLWQVTASRTPNLPVGTVMRKEAGLWRQVEVPESSGLWYLGTDIELKPYEEYEWIA